MILLAVSPGYVLLLLKYSFPRVMKPVIVDVLSGPVAGQFIYGSQWNCVVFVGLWPPVTQPAGTLTAPLITSAHHEQQSLGMKFLRLSPTSKVGKWRLAALLSIFMGILCYAYVPAAYYYARYSPAKGDFIFQSLPRIDLVEAIEGASGSKYSHVGLVIDKDGAWYVREAISTVRDTPLYLWILRGRGRNFDVYQLKPEFSKNIAPMIDASKKYLGRPYDFRYRLDDEFIYCSELLYKAYFDATGVHLGTLKKLGQLEWRPYGKTIEKYENGPVPLERDMITPIDLAKAPELRWIYGNY